MSRPDPDRLPELPLAGGAVERAGHRRGDALLGTLLADPDTRVLEVAAGRCRLDEDGRLLLRRPLRQDSARLAVFLGEDRRGTGQVAVAVDASPDDESWLGLRALGPRLGPLHAGLAVQAVAVLNWHATHPRCPRCGEPTVVVQSGYARRCPTDGSEHYPRTDPAVIMTVVDDQDRVLLGRHVGWAEGRFSTLAGFVEPGESLEVAVRREVAEEVGVRVGDVSYLGSQPWPFPSSVMVGFRARAESTTLRVDGIEIAEARWFTRAELPRLVAQGVVGLSPRLSISRALIEHWYGAQLLDAPH